METQEEIRIWEALRLLTQVTNVIDVIAGRTRDKDVYHNFRNAAAKLKEVEAAIIPLRDL
jgi:hypothetical protein